MMERRFERALLLASVVGLLAFAGVPAPVAAQQDTELIAVPTTQSAAKADKQRARKRLRIDDGSAEQVISLADTTANKTVQIVVLNRFTPGANALPLSIDSIRILFPETCQAGDTGLRDGMTFEALIYVDTSSSGDPENAILVARQPFQVRPDDGRFTRIQLDTPVTVAAGDVWIGYTNSAPANQERVLYHAALDTTSDRGRSWIFYNQTGSSFTGNVLTDAQVRHTIAEEGVPGNWMIRARGRIGGASVEVE
jgi:hypothetical protein